MLKKILAVIILIVIFAFTSNIYSNAKEQKETTELLPGKTIQKIEENVIQQSKTTFGKINNKVESIQVQDDEEENTSDKNENAELPDEKEYDEEPEEELTYGDAGRLIIEDVGISVPLNLAVCDVNLFQYYVDLPDSACLFDFRDEGDLSLGIGDHNYQGFDALYYVTPGMVAKILQSDGTESDYICTYVDRNATNDRYYITDSQGRKVTCIDENILYMYTCNPEGWQSVTVTLWEPC